MNPFKHVKQTYAIISALAVSALVIGFVLGLTLVFRPVDITKVLIESSLICWALLIALAVCGHYVHLRHKYSISLSLLLSLIVGCDIIIQS